MRGVIGFATAAVIMGTIIIQGYPVPCEKVRVIVARLNDSQIAYFKRWFTPAEIEAINSCLAYKKI